MEIFILDSQCGYQSANQWRVQNAEVRTCHVPSQSPIFAVLTLLAKEGMIFDFHRDASGKCC